ncbi:uncharacterized protein EDB91DRAFT_1167778, partial [Suillus paluster]|uniref:uncharacterized protein n=1 Tax=Suillus paluster TaxID=48578 RepID=UPI001B87376E
MNPLPLKWVSGMFSLLIIFYAFSLHTLRYLGILLPYWYACGVRVLPRFLHHGDSTCSPLLHIFIKVRSARYSPFFFFFF